jgi:hypothetical protein
MTGQILPAKKKNITPQAMKWIKKHFGDNFKLRKGGY